MNYEYSRNFDPPAPVIEVSISAPLSKASTSSTAFVDSGADITVIPEQIIAQLKLRRVDSAAVSGFSKSVVQTTVYTATLEIEGIAEPRIHRIIGWSEDYALIGRDLLNRFIAVLNGPGQELSLQ